MKKHIVNVVSAGRTDKLEVPHGANLLEVFQEHGIELFAPCGGKGKCGKCKVRLEEGLTVTACRYRVERDIRVMIPEQRFQEVQVDQYRFTREVSFSAGKEARLVASPMGMAIDLGTTTIAYYLVSLKTGSLLGIRTGINPQVRFGGDVISRINYCMTRKEGLNQLREAVIQSINREAGLFAKLQHFNTDSLVKVVVTGNNTMLHLFSGTDPGPIALAPFTPAFTGRFELTGATSGLKCHPEARVILLPSVSAYVGADVISGIASIDEAGITTCLYLDIGTNGEMALITRGKIWCCAAAAGPAFEGAGISSGSGAVEGAISQYGKTGFSTIAGKKPVSICGSGLIDLIAYLLEEGHINGEGNLKETFLVSTKERNGIDKDITVNQQDIREVQLAKAAIAAGIKLLMKNSGFGFDQIDRLFLAGGFGNYLDPASAVRIGLLPEEMAGKITQIGNAAGTGALLAIKSEDMLASLEAVREKAEYIELSDDEDFPEEFAMQMNFRTS